MISVLGRSTTLASALKASTASIASTTNLLSPPVTHETEVSTPKKVAIDVKSGNLRISSGIGAGLQIRCAHTDFQAPDFDAVRRTATLDPKSQPRDSADSRRVFTYLVGAACITTGSYAAKTAVQEAVLSMSASADVLALSQIEINIDKIPEGKSMTFKWRGKPVFVKHRTDAEIATERAVDISTLRDPQTDDERVIDPKFMVVVGVCTHLGCVPIAGAGDYGGYYCPCHGSHYDGSGRIRKGPAPLNLEVPKHVFPEPGALIVG